MGSSRGAAITDAPSSPRLSVGLAIQDGWQTFRRSPWPFVFFALAAFILSTLVDLIPGVAGFIATTLVDLWATIGIMRGAWIGLNGNARRPGNRGADVLIGGSGKNTYIYDNVKDSRASKGKADHILNFGRKDKIDLSAVAKELRFIGDDRFTGTPGDVRFKKGSLELDKNGDGRADLALQLPGTDTKSITASNLIL